MISIMPFGSKILQEVNSITAQKPVSQSSFSKDPSLNVSKIGVFFIKTFSTFSSVELFLKTKPRPQLETLFPA